MVRPLPPTLMLQNNLPIQPATSLADHIVAFGRVLRRAGVEVGSHQIMDAVRANVREGNKQISLATEDMFIWGQVHTDTPFYFPNREALVDLYRDVVETPGVEQHVLSHSTIAPAVVDPELPTSSADAGCWRPSNPTPWMRTASPSRSIGAPRALMQPKVEAQSAPVE